MIESNLILLCYMIPDEGPHVGGGRGRTGGQNPNAAASGSAAAEPEAETRQHGQTGHMVIPEAGIKSKHCAPSASAARITGFRLPFSRCCRERKSVSCASQNLDFL